MAPKPPPPPILGHPMGTHRRVAATKRPRRPNRQRWLGARAQSNTTWGWRGQWVHRTRRATTLAMAKLAIFIQVPGLSPIWQLGQAPPLDGHGAGSRPCGGARSGMRPHTCTRQPPMCLPWPSFGLGASRPAWRLKNGHNSMPQFGANVSLELAAVPALGLAVAPKMACGLTRALGNPPRACRCLALAWGQAGPRGGSKTSAIPCLSLVPMFL